jgi:hypothetical protein
MADELALGASVAFAKRMQGVDLAKVKRRPFAKVGFRQSGKVFFLRQSVEYGFGRRLDMDVMGEKIVALGDVNIAALPGLCV